MKNIINQKIAQAARQVERRDLSKEDRELWYARLEQLLAWREQITT